MVTITRSEYAIRLHQTFWWPYHQQKCPGQPRSPRSTGKQVTVAGQSLSQLGSRPSQVSQPVSQPTHSSNPVSQPTQSVSQPASIPSQSASQPAAASQTASQSASLPSQSASQPATAVNTHNKQHTTHNRADVSRSTHKAPNTHSSPPPPNLPA